ncbi:MULTISPECIES: PASTA domain-containing protein [unclassified Kitasatospora]|uniref:PASTA domain-containing protein n=1 Tax=unclassified Kitasatospora TaxID=2633591 RepID=UPI00070990D8|nr:MULTISPECIES: PASTA domain-containing protein [unclassified Kitasatospora]KQV03390.1 hypothetical protein ASC99_16455 [Kitasatospora sp. Root107]KRB66025.1 hypothetical protein ASE03_31015 [Kitasatospora sp. Root187]
MSYRRTALATVGLIAALTACDPQVATPTSNRPPTTAASIPAPAQPAATPASAPKTAELSNFVGMGLQSAQDKAPAAGFFSLTSHDALGRSRSQVDDRNWKVCAQAPAAGQQPVDSKVDFATVKLDEQCSAADQGGSTLKAGGAMPDFKGKAVSAVKDALPRSTSYTLTDVLQSREVLVDSNWQVCSQDPAVGAALNGQPVTLRVVKFGEKCP